MEKTICELFAGVGGFHLAFDRANADWNVTWFSQWEPNKTKQWAHECYVRHFGDIDARTGIDIAQVNKTLIPNFNLLVGGFPCQNYSVAASKSSKGIEGEKGVLWWQIRDTLIAKRPAFVLLENVDRLLKSPASQRGRDFGIMLTCFAQLGYTVEWRVINAAEYGAAQRRRRTFIFAYRDNTVYAQNNATIGLDTIIRTGFFATAFNVSGMTAFSMQTVPVTNISNIPIDILLADGNETANNDLLNVSKDFKHNFLNAGVMKNGFIITAEVTPVEEKPILLKQVLEKNAAEEFYISDDKLEKWTYLKGSKKINRTAKNGHEYVFSEGPVPFPDPINKPSRTMLTSESSLNRSTHVIEDPKTKRLRLLTPIETERLQGFEDNWTLGMPEKFRYFCMGNALVVPMVTRMANVLGTIFNAEP